MALCDGCIGVKTHPHPSGNNVTKAAIRILRERVGRAVKYLLRSSVLTISTWLNFPQRACAERTPAFVDVWLLWLLSKMNLPKKLFSLES